VYIIILFDQDMLLGFTHEWLNNVFNSNKLLIWISKPLFKCIYCNSGQISLWFYLFYKWNDYNFIEHILFTSLTIFISHVFIKKIGKF